MKPRANRLVQAQFRILPFGVPGEHSYCPYVQSEGLLRCQFDIVSCPHHDRAA